MEDYAHMSTWEYAYELQRKMFGGDMDEVTAGWCDALAASLLGSLPPEQRHLIDNVPIIVLPTKNPNAMIISAPNESYVIAVDYGLISLLNTLNKIILCRLSIFGLDPNISQNDAYRMSKAAIEYFLEKNSSLPSWPVPPKKMLVSSALSSIQTSFIIGHEIGHMLLGHLKISDHSEVKRIGPNYNPEDPFYVTHAYKAFKFRDKPEQEIEADRRAAELILTHFGKTYDPLFGDSEKAYALAGVDILFSYFESAVSG